MIHKKSNNRFYPIEGFSGYYINKVTTAVLCINEPLPVILDQVPNSLGKDNYFLVTLSDNKNHFIHRLMAKTFLAGPEKPHVNHIDGNKQNNALANLEWATPKENAQHAVNTGLADVTLCRKEVHKYELGGKYLCSYVSDAEAEQATNVAKQNISKTTLGKRPQAGGYQWRRIKLEQITPVNIRLVQLIRILDVHGNTIDVYPTKQDFYTETAQVSHKPKYRVAKMLASNDVMFIDDCRFEKIYFK